MLPSAPAPVAVVAAAAGPRRRQVSLSDRQYARPQIPIGHSPTDSPLFRHFFKSCGPQRASCSMRVNVLRRSNEESGGGGGEIDWDNLGFGLTPTDYMYVTRCSPEDRGDFPRGELCRYGNIELSPSSGVLNYAQVRPRSVPSSRSLVIKLLYIDDGDETKHPGRRRR